MFRYKVIIGSSLRARTLPAQKTEAKVACSVLNRMTRLGMPVFQRVRGKRLGMGLHAHNLNCAPRSLAGPFGPYPTTSWPGTRASRRLLPKGGGSGAVTGWQARRDAARWEKTSRPSSA